MATIRLTGPAPAGGTALTLKSSKIGVASAPGSVRVPGGTTSVDVAITTAPVAASTPVTIAASGGGASSVGEAHRDTVSAVVEAAGSVGRSTAVSLCVATSGRTVGSTTMTAVGGQPSPRSPSGPAA